MTEKSPASAPEGSPPVAHPAPPRTVKLVLVATTADDDLSWLQLAPKDTPWIQDRFGPEQASHQDTVQAVAGNLAWLLMAKAGVAPR